MFKKRLNEKIDERLRQARRDIDAVIDQLKEKSDALAEKASLRAAGAMVNTGESGAARAEARAAIDRIVEELRNPAPSDAGVPAGAAGATAAALAVGVASRLAGSDSKAWSSRSHGSQSKSTSAASGCARRRRIFASWAGRLRSPLPRRFASTSI